MANCKICNAIIPEGMEICEECRDNPDLSNELYLDQLLASVTGEQTQSFNEDDIELEESKEPELMEEEILYPNEEEIPSSIEEDIFYSEEELQRNTSKDDDWILLNQTIHKSAADNKERSLHDNVIPDEGALDEVENILDDYDAVLEEIANGGERFSEIDVVQDTEEDQSEFIASLATDDFMDTQDDIMHISDDFVEEDMENPLIDEDVFQAMDAEMPELYEDEASLNTLSIEEELVNEPELMEEAMEAMEPELIEEAMEAMEPEVMEEPMEPMEPEVMEQIMEAMEPELYEETIEPVLNEEVNISSVNEPQEIFTPIELSDEMTELDRLLGEVTENVDDFNLVNIMSMDVMKEEPEQQQPKKIDASDILSQSLSAVSDLEDADLEARFNDILPTETPKVEKQKSGLFERVFGNITPENPEEELAKLAEEEELEKEKKKQKAEENQKKKESKKALKEEKKAQKVVAINEKRKKQAEVKEKKRKAKEAIAAAYVPEGKINKVGAVVIFVMAACLAFVIIKGTDLTTYRLTIKSAEKDFKIAKYDQAYESLSGKELKEQDTVVYDKLQTIMIVKKQLNSYYHFREMNMPLEALDSVLKGIDRYERYYADAKDLKVDQELDFLKKQMLDILKKTYDVSEKEALGLIAIEDGQTYTEKLTSIVKNTSDTSFEDKEQVVQK